MCQRVVVSKVTIRNVLNDRHQQQGVTNKYGSSNTIYRMPFMPIDHTNLSYSRKFTPTWHKMISKIYLVYYLNLSEYSIVI